MSILLLSLVIHNKYMDPDEKQNSSGLSVLYKNIENSAYYIII